MTSTEQVIASTTLGSAASTITFSGIPSTYTDLRLVFVGTSDSGTPYTNFRINSDTGSNYSSTFISGNGSSAVSGNRTNNTAMIISLTSTLSTTIPILLDINLFSYAGSTNKTVLSATSSDKNGDGPVERVVGLWRNTSAVTSVTLYTTANNFATGTTATLYGIL